MSNNVFANGREISCKKADGKTICAFPDICMTPPVTGFTPNGIPIPYPNTGLAKDTTKGSKSVKISGKEIIKKNVSYYKTSYGDEAGCATPAKKGIITGTIKGKVYFTSWSMNVKVEDENAVRHLDTTTHNHGSHTANETIPWPYIDSMTAEKDPCDKEKKKVKSKCKGKMKAKDRCPEHSPPKEPAGRPKSPKNPNKLQKAAHSKKTKAYKSTKDYKKWITNTKTYYSKRATKNAKDPCLRAMKCMLVPYKPDRGGQRCCPGQTPHHLIEKASFKGVPGTTSYDADKAPCICCEGTSWHLGSHAMMHTVQGNLTLKAMKKNGSSNVTFKQAKDTGAKTVSKVFPESGCRQECIKAQLKSGHKRVKEEKLIKGAPCGDTSDKAVKAVEAKVEKKLEILKSSTSGTGGSR